MTYRAAIVPQRDEENAVYMEFMNRKHFTSRDWKQLMSMVLSLAGESIDYDRMTITVVNADTGKFCFAFSLTREKWTATGSMIRVLSATFTLAMSASIILERW